MKVLGVVLLVIVCAATVVQSQYLPIPKRYPGMAKGSADAPVRLEFYGDFQCPGCAAQFPVVNQVVNYYGPDKVYFIFHTYPLWMHRQGWDAALAGAVVRTVRPSAYWEFATYMFANQAQIYNNVYANKTENDLIAWLAETAARFGVNKTIFYQQFNSSAIYNLADEDKHLGIASAIFGTPGCLINGFKIPLNDSWTVADWRKVIDPLLA
eukprot:TRINITY_DN4105_c0_g1_i1.p2 TRINITY_DN4105_c0_g1~~TRINITY_DN4105_c0_g1_i1.p2  ORF type:complete len:210 (-),score=29.64 TRINITY_DN4105_c0_g1_i1:69-698(-)